MTRKTAVLALISAFAAAGAIAATGGAEASNPAQSSWWGCCGVRPWNQGGKAIGGLDAGGMMRNRTAMMVGIPPSYAGQHNPLPKTKATVARGAHVYDHYCAACHGVTGLGDGRAGRALALPPANLAALSRMPISHWDPFMFWTVTEGGASVHTAMPAFKNSLSANDRWAVIAYIQARLPRIKSR